MKLSITLEGYRNFLEPVTITIGDGNIALIGPNNSGKSNFFRFLYEFKSHFYQLPNLIGRDDINISPNGLKDTREFLPRNSKVPFKATFQLHDASNPGALTEIEMVNKSIHSATTFVFSGKYINGHNIKPGESRPRYVGNSTPNNDEISIALQSLSNSKYFGASRTSIASYGSGNHFDLISGGQLANIWDQWRRGDSLGDDDLSRKITSQLSEIFDLPNLSIIPNRDATDLFFDIDGYRHSLKEMGFGVSQFFSVLVNAAQQRPSILLIDEPESNLHASLQLKFFNALNEYCESIVFSTHSIGLAKQVAQRIYSFVPCKPSVKVKEFYDPQFLTRQLGDLSFSAHLEIGFDRLLLVEGPTDIQVFQTILQTLKLTGKTVVLNLGGSSNINANAATQIEELLRLMQFDEGAPNIAVIIDSEYDGVDPKQSMIKSVADYKKLLTKRKIPNCILKKRSIENYFTVKHLSETGSSLNPLSEFEKVPDTWDKSKNFKFAARMTKEEILSTDFGKFMIEQLS